MGQRMREGMHIVTTAKAESVGEIELGVDEHENGCRLNVQIKKAWDVVEEELLLLDSRLKLRLLASRANFGRRARTGMTVGYRDGITEYISS